MPDKKDCKKMQKYLWNNVIYSGVLSSGWEWLNMLIRSKSTVLSSKLRIL